MGVGPKKEPSARRAISVRPFSIRAERAEGAFALVAAFARRRPRFGKRGYVRRRATNRQCRERLVLS